MLQPLLDVRSLSHRFDGRAGERIHFGSFALAPGRMLLISGASGCGKSTLLHLLAGVLPIAPDSGAAVLNGTDIAALSAAGRDRLRPATIGWMPQRQFMIASLSVIENVLLPAALSAKVHADLRVDASRLLEAVGVAGLSDQRPATLSVGQAARVCLARALLPKPKLLLADEPTAALDERSALLVATQICAFVAAGGAAIVASHDPQLRAMLFANAAGSVSEIALAA